MSQGQGGGRPLAYKTLAELQKVTNAYFMWCEEKSMPLTMAGLARRLGLSRQALMEYSHRAAFGDAIKEARARVEEYNESQLHIGRNATGPIFNLKCNFGWRDNLDENGKPPPNPIVFVNQVPTAPGQPQD